MGRRKVPGLLKTGETETRKQKLERHDVEQTLINSDDIIYLVPDHLPDMAKMYYQFIIDELKAVEILANIDQPLIEQTALCLSTIRECDDKIAELGLFYEEMDRYGHVKMTENIAVKTKLNYLAKYNQFCASLGMSPSSRASLAAKKIEMKQNEEDPLIQILKGSV